MKTVKITTPENIEIEYDLAGLGSRAAAVVIDFLIQGVALLILAIGLMIAEFNPLDAYETYSGWVIGISLIIFFVITYGYFIICELTMNGKTPGKKMFHLRTIRNNGQPITIKHSIIRNLFRVIIDLYGIGTVLIFFSKEHKRVGDYAASTMVIVEEKKEIPANLEIEFSGKVNYKYSITQEEYSLLKDYFNRKENLGEHAVELEIELGKYFCEKFEVQKSEKEYDGFLKELVNRETL
ncbi:RDD family protein [Lutibacter sp. B2]|nr:RDD family protein [Lutibacter sp. B2]